MKMVSLGKICRIEAGAGFPLIEQGLTNQQFPFFKVGDMNSLGNEREMVVFQHSISEQIRKKLGAIAFPAGTVIFPKIGAAISTNKKRVIVRPSCVDNNVMALIPGEKLLSDFLYYLLQNKDLNEFANTGNPPSIRQTTIEEWEIPLPPLPEQRRIAALLAKADRLRRLRRYANQLGETYLQSVFVEMFGEPARNEKGWEFVTLKELILSKDTINYGVVQPGDDFPGGVPVVRVGDFDAIPENTEGLKRIDPQIEADYKRSRLKGNEILIACVGSIGKIALVDERLLGFNIVRATARVPVGDSINRLFLATYLQTQFVQEYFTKETRTVSQPTLNIEHIEETPVPLPPLSEQERFAAVVRRYERLRAQGREAERQAELLFQSLLAQSFDGGR